MSQGENPDFVEILDTTAQRRDSIGLLVGGFLFAFALACLSALLIGHYTLQAPRSLVPGGFTSSIAQYRADAIKEPFLVSSPGVFRKAVGGEKLNPLAGQDYTMFVWLRLRRVPAPGETFALVSKFDPHVPFKPGYALSLEGAPDGVRPKVYLSAAAGGGRWYSFAVHPMTRKNWYLLSVSLSQDAFISTHIGQYGADNSPVLLGAYNIRLPALPLSASDIIVGAIGASRFRGQIGPFGVLSAKGLQQELPNHLAKMLSDPAEVPSSLERDSIMLWATPSKDLSSASFAIEQGVQIDPKVSAPASRAPKYPKASKSKQAMKKAPSVKAVKGKRKS